MLDDYFDYTQAINPQGGGVLQPNAEALVYAITDTTFSTPLQITDLNGIPMDKLRAGPNSVYPQFKVMTGETQVNVKSGDLVTRLTSILGAPLEVIPDPRNAADGQGMRVQGGEYVLTPMPTVEQMEDAIGAAGKALNTAMKQRFSTVIRVRERTTAETDDGPAFDEALAAAAAAGSGVVQWPSGRDITLPGGHVAQWRTLIDFGYNRVTHAGNNTLLTMVGPESPASGIGEVVGGVVNAAFACSGGSSLEMLRLSGSWGAQLRNIEMLDHGNGVSGGVGIHLYNPEGSWTEGTVWDNVMVNMFSTGIRFSGPGLVGDHSSFAYQRMMSVGINVPKDGIGWDISGNIDDRVFPYQGVYNITMWLRKRSVGVKLGTEVDARNNTVNLRCEAFDIGTNPADRPVIFDAPSGSLFTANGGVSTLSTTEVDFQRGTGTVKVSPMLAAYSSRSGSRDGNTIRIADLPASTLGDIRGSGMGSEYGPNVERPIAVGYNGSSDVFRAYGIIYEQPGVANWRTFFGAANSRITLGGETGPDVQWWKGTGSPEGVITANVGSMYSRTDGAAGSVLYVKRSGTGNTGWFAVA